MTAITCKYGGTSVATAQNIRTIKANTDRLTATGHIVHVVVSARGARFDGDVKETALRILGFNILSDTRELTDGVSDTDLRWVCRQSDKHPEDLQVGDVIALIVEPLMEIGRQLELDEGWLRDLIMRTCGWFHEFPNDYDLLVSAGEYLMGMIIARYLGIPFRDPTELFRFTGSGRHDDEISCERIAEHCTTSGVIPGFYGAERKRGDEPVKIRTFPRGGSDITAAWFAKATGSIECQFWSDPPGVFMADPRVIKLGERMLLSQVTYREMDEADAQVLHSTVSRILCDAGINARLCCIFDPTASGTLVVPERKTDSMLVRLIIGHPGYVAINTYKLGFHNEVGGVMRLLRKLDAANVPFHQLPLGTNGAMIAVHKSHLSNGKLSRILEDIDADFDPDNIEHRDPEMVAINIVGQGLNCSTRIIGRACEALDRAGVRNLRFITGGGSSETVTIGINTGEHEVAISALNSEFILG